MSDEPRSRPGRSTLAVRGGEGPNAEDALTTPIYQTSTYVFDDTSEILRFNRGETQRWEYGRYGNPTQRAVERKLAALEGAADALLFPSGMNALVCTVLSLVRAGDHVVLTEDCYRNTWRFAKNALPRLGIEVTCVRAGDPAAVEGALRPNTRVALAESPTNPHLRVADLAALV